LIIFVVFLLALSFISARNFTIYNSTNPSQAYFSIDGTTGRVGIGTMNALQGLHVIGNILANGTINATRDICIQGGICLSGIAITASGEPLWTGNWTNVAFTNTHETFNENVTFMKNISFSANANLQGIYFDSLYWVGERLAFGADSTGTIIQSTDNDVGDGIHFKAHGGGNDLMIINNTGYVGIGTSSPQERFHVAGNARIDGTLNTNSNKIINIANGTNAQDAVTYSQLITQNTSQTNLINLNNQSVTNYINSVASIGEPNWNANYSIFLTHATTSYVDLQNTSQNNWISGAYNTTRNNYVAFVNTSMRNYVNLQNTSMKNYVDNQIISNEYDDSWINQTIYNTTQVNAINTSMKNYVDSTFTNENYVNSQNTSMRNYVNAQNTSQTNLINLNNQSVTNAINAVAAIGEPNWNANYSIFLTHATTSYVNTQNLSMRNYVNLQNTSQNSWISGAYNTTRNNYVTFVNASMRNYVNLQNTSQTNLINLNNQSVTNYINSVASIGEPNWNANFTAFNQSWSSTYNSTYNMWAYNQTIPANSYTDSRVASANLHTHDASNITSPIWVNKTGDTMSGNLNMDSNNITAVDCITFASGGRICSG